MDEEGAGLEVGEGVRGPRTLQSPEEGPGQRWEDMTSLKAWAPLWEDHGAMTTWFRRRGGSCVRLRNRQVARGHAWRALLGWPGLRAVCDPPRRSV